MSSRILFLSVALLASTVTHARDLIIHIDFPAQTTITRDISSDEFRKQLEAFNPGYEILSLTLSGASQRGRPGDLGENVHADLAKGLGQILREHSGQVAKLILDGDGSIGYVHHLGSVGGLGPNKDEHTLAEVLAPLKGRMRPDASVILTGGRMFYEQSQAEFAGDVRTFLVEMGAPRGSLFAMSSLWADIPSWKAEYLRTARILGSGFVGTWFAAGVSGGDPATAWFAGLGAPLVYLASWPLFGQAGTAVSGDDRRNTLGALGSIAAVLAAQAAFDPKMAIIGVMVTLTSYAQFTVSQFLMMAVPKIRLARRGQLNTGTVFSLGEDVRVRETRIRADKSWRRLFTCESDLNDNFSGETLDVGGLARARLLNVR